MLIKLKIIAWNARGIHNKNEEFRHFLSNNNIDICLVSETWLKNATSINICNYSCYINGRTENRGGGVAIFIKKIIRHSLLPLPKTNLIETIGVRILNIDGTETSIFSCYFPGGQENARKKQLFQADIHKLTSTNGIYIMGGDLNCRHQSWGCARANSWGKLLKSKVDCNSFYLMHPSEHTYIPAGNHGQPSTLDLYLTNRPQNLATPRVLNELNSDHLPVLLEVTDDVACSENCIRYDH